VSLLVIAVRIVWVFAATYFPRFIWRSIHEREGTPGPSYVFVIAWSGMRGIVSLAAALALPYDFPQRNLIVFITFCVIFTTLVLQGLSLIPLLKWLRISSGEDLEKREIEVRVEALRAGIAALRKLEAAFDSTEEWEVQGRIVGEYEYRIVHLSAHIESGNEVERANKEIAVDHRLEQAALDAERVAVIAMRSNGEIPDEIYRTIEYDLDLAQARLT
jgi:CPA1 family monovalent cation:H+ antiporter